MPGTVHPGRSRRKTRVREDGDLEDLSVADDSPFPGVGMDDETPLGDSPELHDDITPHDLPRGHRGRRRLERQTVFEGDIPREDV